MSYYPKYPEAKINFETLVQEALWKNCLVGQISDGRWENTRPYEHYYVWCQAETAVNPENVGVNFWPIKNNYNFTSLIQYTGEDMKFIAKLAILFPVETAKAISYGVSLPDSAADFHRYGTQEWSKKYYDTWVTMGFTAMKIEEADREVFTEKDLRRILSQIKVVIKTHQRG